MSILPGSLITDVLNGQIEWLIFIILSHVYYKFQTVVSVGSVERVANVPKDRLTTQAIKQNSIFRAKALQEEQLIPDEGPSLKTSNSVLSVR